MRRSGGFFGQKPRWRPAGSNDLRRPDGVDDGGAIERYKKNVLFKTVSEEPCADTQPTKRFFGPLNRTDYEHAAR